MRPESTAYLSSCRGYINFFFGGKNIRFKGPYSLVKFDKVKEWDNGYLVVEALYAHENKVVEDYIDLVPILKELYMDPAVFLKPIKNVEIRYV